MAKNTAVTHATTIRHGKKGKSFGTPKMKHMAGGDVAKSMYKKPRTSTGTVVESAMGHKSAKQVYAARKAPVELTGNETGLVVNQARLKVQQRGGGWARVTYTDPNAKGPITFNIRMKQISGVMNKAPSAWFHPAEAVYSKWISTTKAGAEYTARRQVEGMYKTALKRGDDKEAERLQGILKKSDKEVAKFRKEWEEAHTDEEISDWYDYEEEEVVW